MKKGDEKVSDYPRVLLLALAEVMRRYGNRKVNQITSIFNSLSQRLDIGKKNNPKVSFEKKLENLSSTLFFGRNEGGEYS